ncbi:MAG: type IV pili methyl-accepting chemotaxis transducer N-terminal domain-containing protein [Pseudomonadota bacterium]
MRLSLKRVAVLVPVIVTTFILPLHAQQSVSLAPQGTYEENAEERINFSGKLRMLSQRIPSAACHLSRGIDVEGAGALLKAAPVEFEKILTALEFGGDADLNIKHPETRPKTLLRIRELRAAWEPMKAAAAKLSEGTGTDEDVNFILTQNMAVLGAAVRLVPELVKQYSNPNAVPYADLLLIDISGRQRMLTQKMSKESCMLGTSHRTADTPAQLEGTMRIFEAFLTALRFGMPELGLKAPPNASISQGPDVAQTNWMSVKPFLTTILSDEYLDNEADTFKFQRLNTTIADMNKVVGLYTAAAKPSS